MYGTKEGTSLQLLYNWWFQEDDGDAGVAADAPEERLFDYDGRDDGDYFDSSYL